MKTLLFTLITALLLAGCIKNENNNVQNCDAVNVTAPAGEVATLKAYLDTNHITATADPRGFFYTINAEGTGTKPTVCSNVTVAYAGRLLNGQSFDQSANASFNLSGLITGWKEAIPLIGTGGSMRLYLPPGLGYGANASGPIPANSYLIFDITLKQVF